MSAVDPRTGLDALARARGRRAMMLVRLRRLAETDGRACLPALIDACQDDPAILRLRAWRADQAVFGTGRTKALRHVETAARWCGASDGMPRPGDVTMGWILDARTQGARLAAWLLAIGLDMGFQLTGPDPYHGGGSHAEQTGGDRAQPAQDLP